MHFCKPLEDEFSRSHILRLQFVNGLRSQTEFRQALQATCSGSAKSTSEPLAAIAAHACSVPLNQYIARHTFLSYWPTRIGVQQRTNQVSRSRLKLYGFDAPNPWLTFCQMCRAKDLERHGFSYWHRRHQIFGAVYCISHATQLHTSGQRASSATDLPHHHRRYPLPLLETSVPGAQRDAIVRYQELGERLLRRTQPIRRSVQFQFALEWIQARIDGSEPAQKASSLYRLVVHAFGEAWLRTFWCSAKAGASPNEISHRIYAVLQPDAAETLPLEVLMIMLTAMTGSTEESSEVLDGSLLLS